MYELLQKLIVSLTALVASLTLLVAPMPVNEIQFGAVLVVDTKETWDYSVGTMKFDTADGRMEPGTYSLSEIEPHYWVYRKSDSQKEPHTRNAYREEIGYDISGLREIHIVGYEYFDIFINDAGIRSAIQVTKADYDQLNKPAETVRKPAKFITQTEARRRQLVEAISPKRAFAAVTIANITAATCALNTNALTAGHQVDTGTDLGLTVSGSARNANELTNVQFNGVTISAGADEGAERAFVWYTENPSTSASLSFVINMDATNAFIMGTAISWSGVDQTDMKGVSPGANGNSGTASVSGTEESGSSIFVDSAHAQSDGNTLTVTSGQTERSNQDCDSKPIGSSTEPSENDGTHTMAWTLGSSADWMIAMMEILPAAAAASEPIMLPGFIFEWSNKIFAFLIKIAHAK